MKLIFIATFLSLFTVSLVGQINDEYHYVEGYYRSDGAYVRGHYKTNPNHTINDNYTTKPNINPWTGERGYIEPEGSIIDKPKYLYSERHISNYYTKIAIYHYQYGDYVESVNNCLEAMKTGEDIEIVNELLYKNCVASKEYEIAFKFTGNFIQQKQSKENAARFYVASLLSDNVSSTSVKKDLIKYNLWDEGIVWDEILYVYYNVGYASEKISRALHLNSEKLINMSLLDILHACEECEFDYLDNNVLFLHGKTISSILFMDGPAGNHINGISMTLPLKEFLNSLTMIQSMKEYEYKGVINVPTLVRTDNISGVKKTTQGFVYMNSEDVEIIYCEGDISGDFSNLEGTISIRK